MTTRLEASTTALLQRSTRWQAAAARPAVAAAIVARNIERMVSDGRTPDFVADWLDAQDGSFIDQEIARLDEGTLRLLTPISIGEVQVEIERLLSIEGARRAYNLLPA